MLAVCNRTAKTKDYSNIGHWFVFKDQGGGQCFALCIVEPGLGYPGGLRSSFTSKYTTLTQVQRHALIKWQTPHTFQQSMLSKSTPVLSHAISNFEMFMTDWEKLGDQHDGLKFWTDISLDWAKKYYSTSKWTRQMHMLSQCVSSSILDMSLLWLPTWTYSPQSCDTILMDRCQMGNFIYPGIKASHS